MRRIIVTALIFLSYSAYADLKCQVTTSKSGKVVSEHDLNVRRGVTSYGHIQDLVQEVNKKNQSTVIRLTGSMSGWEGDEYIEVRVYRHEFKYKKYNKSTELTDEIKIEGNGEVELKYENYITKISCVVVDTRPSKKVVDSERLLIQKDDFLKQVESLKKESSSQKK